MYNMMLLQSIKVTCVCERAPVRNPERYELKMLSTEILAWYKCKFVL